LPVRLAVRSIRIRGLTAFFLTYSCLAAQQPIPSPPPPPGLATPAPAPRFVVVLDAAHGGDDPGGKYGSLLEKDLTLALSVRLRSLLAARGVSVITTRESDAAIAPDRRAEIANHAAAQACLSLHATQAGSGVHMFVSSLAPRDPSRIAAWKTAQSAWVARSLALEGVLNSALLQDGLNVTLGRAALPSLDSMVCPAIAIEFAPATAQKGQAPGTALDDPAYQARLAEALASGLMAWQAEGRQP
jgi:N-acetylmuramoyl-L-alanine amidase